MGLQAWMELEQRDAMAARVKELEAENAMLRQGDTCARQCEGTAYRVELRRLRAACERVDALTRAEAVSPTAFSEAWKAVRACLTPNNRSEEGK